MLVISDRLGSKHMNLERIPCTSDSVGEVIMRQSGKQMVTCRSHQVALP